MHDEQFHRATLPFTLTEPLTLPSITLPSSHTEQHLLSSLMLPNNFTEQIHRRPRSIVAYIGCM